MFPITLKLIGNYVFKGCSGLSGELRLPESLTSIGDGAFIGCSDINRAVYYNSNTKIPKIQNFLTPYFSTFIVGFRHSTAETYVQEYGLAFEELEG